MAFSYRLVTRPGDRTPFGARRRGNARAFSGAAREARSRAEAGAGGAAARGFPSSPPLVTSKVSTPVGTFFVTRLGDRTLSPSLYSKWSRKSHLARSICNLNGIICFIWKGAPPRAHEVQSRAIGVARRGGDARRNATTHRNGNGHRRRTRRGAACPKLDKLVSKSRERLRRMRAIRAHACSFTSAALLRL